ncbi:MAG: DUF4349 domain-containing protein [Chitinophagaceae bacterium]|nr:DUF4349 domain-containing protein [Chitinophagaceae bacterium]
MKNYKTFIVILTIIISACHSEKNKSEFIASTGQRDEAIVYAPEAPPPPQLEEQLKYTSPKIVKDEEVNEEEKPIINQEKKVIKNGSISIKSFQIDSSKKYVNEQLKKYQAYYESEVLSNESDKVSYDLKIRIPSANFEQFIKGIENGKDEIIAKSIQAEDVTEEYVDIETRLNNKRKFLKRYQELLTKANTIKDMMAIEENIRTLQEEIESKEGRLKFLNHQVGYSTLEINLFQPKEYVFKPETQDGFFERVKNSISKGSYFIIDVIIFFIRLWPLAIMGIISYYIINILKSKKTK